MNIDSFTFISLNSSRYLQHLPNNVPQVSKYTFIASSTWELELNITYEALDERLKKHFHIREDSPDGEAPSRLQQYRNHRSTLTGFLASAGKTVESRVGAELRSSFDIALAKYLAMLPVSRRTKADRRVHLNLVKRLSETRDSADLGAQTTFSESLRNVIAATGMPAKTLARKIGVSTSAVQRWLAGAVPNRNGLPTLRRLEHELGLERESLVKLALADANRAPQDAMGDGRRPETHPVTHRERMAQRTDKQGYVLRLSEFTNEFKKEWKDLLDYKTTSFPQLERQTRGVWRLIPLDSVASLPEITNRNGMGCPSAARGLGMLTDFLGTILKLPPENGGCAISVQTPRPEPTLAWLAHPLALQTYIDYLTHKSGGIQHTGHRVFCTFVNGLLRPGSGYLWQQPNFLYRLPPDFRPADEKGWRDMCESSHKVLRAIKGNSTSLSRIPTEPIAFLLEREKPLKPILDAITKIDRAAGSATPGGRRQAQLKRDALLLSLMLSNPLRVRTLMSLTWNPHGTGSLRGSPASGWRIELSPSQLKNGASITNRHYNVQVAAWVKPRLDEYIEEYRGTLLNGAQSKYLFVSVRSSGIWKTLGKRVFELTRQYIEGSPGFGPHGFRHLIATDWLTRYPNDFLTVADLLNDNLSTVLKHYAHLKRDSSFGRFEKHIQSML